MSGLRISMFRRFKLEESQDSVLRGILRSIEWVQAQSEAVDQLHVGGYVLLRHLGLVAHGAVTQSGCGVWRVCFVSKVAGQGHVMVEVSNMSPGVLRWMSQLYDWMTDGLYEDHMSVLESSYRKRLRGELNRIMHSGSFDSDESLVRAYALGLAPLCAEFLSVVALLNSFGSEATRRTTYAPSRFRVQGSEYFVERLGRWFYEPWSELSGTTQPVETICMLTFLRSMYESAYRKMLKECDVVSEDLLRLFVDSFEDAFISALRSDDLLWGNSILPSYLSYMVTGSASPDGWVGPIVSSSEASTEVSTEASTEVSTEVSTDEVIV